MQQLCASKTWWKECFDLSVFIHLIVTKNCESSKVNWRQSGIATDLRPYLLGESLFLTVLHCKHTTGHASFSAVCQATGIPSLCFSLSPFLFQSLSPHSRLLRQANGRRWQDDYWTSKNLFSLSLVCRTFLTRLYYSLSFPRAFLTYALTFLPPPVKIVFWDGPKHWRERDETLALKCDDQGKEGIVGSVFADE